MSEETIMPTAANCTFNVPGAYCSLGGNNMGEVLDNFVALSNAVQAFFGTLTDRLPAADTYVPGAPGSHPVSGTGPHSMPGVASQFAAEVETAAEPAPRKRGRRSAAEKAEAAQIVDASPSVQRAMAEQRAATAAAAGPAGTGGKVHSITALLTAANASERAGLPAEPVPSVGATKPDVIAALDDYARTFGQPAAKAYIGAWLQSPNALLKDVSPDLFDDLVNQIRLDIYNASAVEGY